MGTKNSCKTAAVMGLIGRGPAAEAVSPAPVERSRDIETITVEILDAKRAGGEAILTIGKGLMEAKALLSHGEWLPWLEERVEFSEKAAQRFMKLAREYSNPTALSDLGATKALMLLAIPAENREEFISEAHMVDGEEKTVIDMTSRELEAVIKERDEALKAAAQAQAEQSAAEQAREKIAADMALANERIAGLNAEVEARTAAAARLEKELEELRSRPVDVAVEADPAAIEAARKEAEAAMQTQLDKVKKTVDDANKARKAAEKDLEDAHRVLAKMRDENCVLREKMERADKKASLTANEDFVLFRTLLDQTRELANKMVGVLLKTRNKDPEGAKGMEADLLALSGEIRDAAQGSHRPHA